MREVIPHYGRGKPLSEREVALVAEWADLDVTTSPDQEALAILWWPMPDFRLGGRSVYHLVLASHLKQPGRSHVILHECHHVRRGDSVEPTSMVHSCALPMCEPAADMFATIGLLRDDDYEHGLEHLEHRMWQIAPLPDRGWEMHRRKDLAPRLMRLRKLLTESDD